LCEEIKNPQYYGLYNLIIQNNPEYRNKTNDEEKHWFINTYINDATINRNVHCTILADTSEMRTSYLSDFGIQLNINTKYMR